MKKLLFITFIFIVSSVSHAQYLAAFSDNQKEFWAFNTGMFFQLEESEVESFQVGGTLIAYLDHSSNFKIYQFGEVQTLLEVAQVKYTTTDYLLGYSLFDTLYVYDDEQINILSTNCQEYIVMDSLIAWQNKMSEALYVYYNGEVTTLAEKLPDFKFESYMAGDNIFAFVDPSTMEFKVFYRGELITLDSDVDEMRYQAGCDILAFTDKLDQSFNLFYKGEVVQLDYYQPKSFQAGDQIMAYLDNQGDLNYFENGEVKNITSEPGFYKVKDHILVYEEQGSFLTICEGEEYIIEQYIPKPYYIDENTISYLEHNESIRVFQHCEHITANKIDVVKFNMVRNIIVFAEDEDKIKVYFNGQVYEHKPDN